MSEWEYSIGSYSGWLRRRKKDNPSECQRFSNHGYWVPTSSLGNWRKQTQITEEEATLLILKSKADTTDFKNEQINQTRTMSKV